MELKRKSFGEIVLGLLLSSVPLIGFMAVQIIVMVVVMVVYLLSGDPAAFTSRVLDLVKDQNILMTIVVYTDIVAVVCVVPVYVFALKERKLANPKKIFSWFSPLAIILLFIGLEMLTSAAMSFAFEIPFLTKIMEGYLRMIESSGLVEMSTMSTIATILLAPIAEEIIFRGMTMKLARKITRKFWIANIIQALFFGIAHGNWVQGTYAFVLGLMLGYIYKKYNSLIASVLAHMTFNFAGTYIVSWMFEKSGIDEGIGLIIEIVAGVVAVIFGLILILKVDKKTPANTEAFNEKYAKEWQDMAQKKLAEQDKYNQLMMQAYMQQSQPMQPVQQNGSDAPQTAENVPVEVSNNGNASLEEV